jgi:DNA-directed RNA polymerase beta subunit
MTIGLLIEMLSGTEMTKHSKIKYCKECVQFKKKLEKLNHTCLLNVTVKEYLYNTSFYTEELQNLYKKTNINLIHQQVFCPFTGEKMNALITFGVLFSQRLKHLSQDKLYYRNSSGCTDLFTRQPKKGRSLLGGHRFGLQECQCVVAQGATRTLNERLFNSSDPLQLIFCANCGILFHGNKNDPFLECKLCKSTDFVETDFPCSTKVLIHLLIPYGIYIKCIPKIID